MTGFVEAERRKLAEEKKLPTKVELETHPASAVVQNIGRAIKEGQKPAEYKKNAWEADEALVLGKKMAKLDPNVAKNFLEMVSVLK